MCWQIIFFPIIILIRDGEHYGSELSRRAHEELYGYYRDGGLAEEEIMDWLFDR